MKDVYTLTEVGEKLHVTRRTLYNYISDGYLTARKLDGYRLYVTAADLKAFTSGATTRNAQRRHKGTDRPAPKSKTPKPVYLTPDEQGLVDRFRELDDDTRAAVLEYIKSHPTDTGGTL